MRRFACIPLVLMLVLGVCFSYPAGPAAWADGDGRLPLADGEAPAQGVPADGIDGAIDDPGAPSTTEAGSSGPEMSDSDAGGVASSSEADAFQVSEVATEPLTDGQDGSAEDSRAELDRLALENRDTLRDGKGYYIHVSPCDGVVVGADAGRVAFGGIAAQRFQTWIATYDEAGYLTLENSLTGMVLDVCGGEAKVGARVQAFRPNGTPAQKWVAVAEGDRIKLVSALGKDLVLGPCSEAGEPGTGLQLSDGAESSGLGFECVDDVAEKMREFAKENVGVFADGCEYVIGSQASRRLVLDVSGSSRENFGNVQVYASNMTGAQKWVARVDADGFVSFINANSGLALDVYGASCANGTNVSQYQYNGTPAQKWVAAPSEAGGYVIYSALYPDIALDIAGGVMDNCTNVRVWGANGTPAQSFAFYDLDPSVAPCEDLGLDGWYTIAPSAGSGCVFDVYGGSRGNGANVRLYWSNGTFAQMFGFRYVDGYYQIVNANSGKVLDLDGGNVAPFTNAQQWDSVEGSDIQLFSISKNDDDTYTFVNKATGLAVDLLGGGTGAGVNVQGYTPHGGETQRFRLQECVTILIDGLYEIVPIAGSNRALDVCGGSLSSGANVWAYSANGSQAQKWQVSKAAGSDNEYVIECVKSGLLLTEDADGNVCQRPASDGAAAQRWVPSLSAGGAVTLKNAQSGLVLDVSDGSMASGANIGVYEQNGTSTQAFYMRPTNVLANGMYVIRFAPDESRVLDVYGGSRANYANVQLWGFNDSGAQKWSFSRNSDGTYMIVNARSGKSLDVWGGQAVSCANVQQFDSNGTAAQRWRVEYAGSGQFKVLSALDDSLVLDVSGGSASDGANVQLYSDNGTTAQRFSFEPTFYDAGKVLNVSRADLVSWLDLNRWNGYYLGTRYSSGFSVSTCMYPNGAPRWDGFTGMNCTGFVAHAYRAVGGDLNPIARTQSFTPWAGGPGGGDYINAWRWYGYAVSIGAERYEFNTVADMLRSGLAEKGDIIFFKTNGSIDCHIGFFWGDSPYDNKMWHQIYPQNCISACFNNANKAELYQQTVLIKGAR